MHANCVLSFFFYDATFIITSRSQARKYLLWVCALLFVGMQPGCTSHSIDKRLQVLESQITGQQVLDLRATGIEDRVTALEHEMGALKEASRAASARYGSQRAKPARRAVPTRVQETVQIVPVPGIQPVPLQGAVSKTEQDVVAKGSTQMQSAQGIDAVQSTELVTPTVTAAEQLSAPASSTPSRGAPADSTDSIAAYNAALKLYESGKYDESARRFEEYTQQYPSTRLMPNALYWHGECFYARGDYGGAILRFKDVAGRFPKDSKAAAALFKIGLSYKRLNDMENATFYWKILQDDFPKSAPARLVSKEQGKR